MNFSTYRFTLDLHKHHSQMSIAAFQHDTAIRLSIGITDGGVPYHLEDGCMAVMYGERPDGEPIVHKCMIEANSRIIYDFNKETAKETGVVECQIRLYKQGEELISAPKFIIVVSERVGDDASVFDSGDGSFEEQFSALDNIFTKETARSEAETARVEAEKVREGNELLRKEKELSRIEFENKRQIEEAKRVKAENERAEGYAQIDAKLDGKLDKTTLPSRLYGTVSTGNQTTYVIVDKPGSKRVPQRDANGDILVNDIPIAENGATSKKYVDTKYSEATTYTSSLYSDINERVSNLENLTLANINDNSEAYEKVIPAKVGSTALVDMVGGRTVGKVKIGNNKLNPADIQFFFETDLSSYDVNYDTGVIDVYLSDGGGYCEIYGMDAGLEDGIYYVHIEGIDSEDQVHLGSNVGIYLHGEWDENGIPEERVVHLKIMLCKKDAYDDGYGYDFVEAPAGTVFEPYHEEMTYTDVKVTRIESYGGNLLNLDVPESFPSDTTVNPTDREFTPNTFVLGMSGNNYYVTDNVRLESITDDKIVMMCTTGYGISFPLKLLPNTKYTVSYKSTAPTPSMLVSFYDDWGVHLRYTSSSKLSYTFTTDEYANVLITFSGAGVSGTTGKYQITFSDIMLTQGDTAAPYKPYSSESIAFYDMPPEVIAMDGYGREGSRLEFRDDDIYLVVTRDDEMLELSAPSETVVTWAFPSGAPFLKIQGGGRLRFVNDLEIAVLSNVWYTVKEK